jgi:hypothetical protein
MLKLLLATTLCFTAHAAQERRRDDEFHKICYGCSDIIHQDLYFRVLDDNNRQIAFCCARCEEEDPQYKFHNLRQYDIKMVSSIDARVMKSVFRKDQSGSFVQSYQARVAPRLQRSERGGKVAIIKEDTDEQPDGAKGEGISPEETAARNDLTRRLAANTFVEQYRSDHGKYPQAVQLYNKLEGERYFPVTRAAGLVFATRFIEMLVQKRETEAHRIVLEYLGDNDGTYPKPFELVEKLYDQERVTVNNMWATLFIDTFKSNKQSRQTRV